MTRVLVTGANGHVGANVIRSLLQRGHTVVPFVRRTSDLRGLQGLGLTYRYGDILDMQSLLAAAEGCEAIIHAAAVYSFWARNPDDIIQPALVGTRNVFEAAQISGIERIVYTSTTFAVGASSDPHTLRTANDWHSAVSLPYAKAKVEAEKLAWQLSEKTQIPMISLCPCGVLGPYDFGITPTTGLLRGWINGTGVTGRGGASFVDVRDVAEVHAQAVTEGTSGQRYILAGENMPMRAYGEIVSRLTGVQPRHLKMGRSASWILGALMEAGARVFGSTPVLTRAMALELIERYQYYDCHKTTQAFGFAPRPAEEMIVDAIRWLLYLGEIRPRVASQFAAKLPPPERWQGAAV